jgi:SAP domain
VQGPSDNGPSRSLYRAGLCQILECRKQLSNKTLVRLGIAKDGALNASAVVMPLVPLHSGDSHQHMFLLDYSKSAPYLASMETIGCEVDIDIMSEDQLHANGLRAQNPVGIVYMQKQVLEGKGGGRVMEGEVDSCIFDGRSMKCVQLPLKQMTVPQLQEELAAWGLRKSGRKPDLQLRLRDALVAADLRRQNSPPSTSAAPQAYVPGGQHSAMEQAQQMTLHSGAPVARTAPLGTYPHSLPHQNCLSMGEASRSGSHPKAKNNMHALRASRQHEVMVERQTAKRPRIGTALTSGVQAPQVTQVFGSSMLGGIVVDATPYDQHIAQPLRPYPLDPWPAWSVVGQLPPVFWPHLPRFHHFPQ